MKNGYNFSTSLSLIGRDEIGSFAESKINESLNCDGKLWEDLANLLKANRVEISSELIKLWFYALKSKLL